MSNPTQPKKKPASEPLKKISIKQFQWYEVQTKVRQLLTQLLQPFTKKQTEDTVKMNQFKRTLGTMSKKLQDHDFLLTQENAQKPTYVQLQDDKIEQLGKKLIQMQIQQNKKISDMQKVIQIYQSKIMQINQLQSRVQDQIKERNNNFKSHKQHIDAQMDLMLKKLDNQDSQINNLRQTTRNTITKLQTRTVVVENRVNSIEDQLKRKTQQMKRLNDQIINLSEKLAATDIATKDLDLRLTEREKDYKLSQKFMARAIQLQNSVSFITNYLQFYQPLYNQMQISETINSFLKGSMKTRACVFEEKIFAQMHYAILSMQEQNLQTKMSQYSNRIRRIVNRNKKYLIRMKVEQTLKYGNNVYEIRELDEGLLQKSEQLTNKPPQIIIPQDQIIKIIEQKWQKMIQSVEQTISEKTDPFKIWIKQLQQQSLLREIDLQKRGSDLKGKIEKQQINTQLCKSQVQQLEKELEKNVQFFAREIKKSRDQIKDIINFSSVINHIVIQDEIDRQGLSLYALKSGTATNNVKGEQNYQQAFPNVHLDQKCVSCQNGNANMIVNQAFKMACLAYNPSQIKVDDKVFTREQILEISTNILDKLKKKNDDIEIPQKRQSSASNKNVQFKSRSKSLVSKQLNTSRPNEYSTIDIPASRLRDTTYLLPVLGSVKKKSFGATTHRDKVNL